MYFICFDPAVEQIACLPQILDQRAAKGHVEDLTAPADAQNGLAGVQISLYKGQLSPVAGRVRREGTPVLLPIQAGIHIAAPGEHKSVEGQVNLRTVLHNGEAAGSTDSIFVVERCVRLCCGG